MMGILLTEERLADVYYYFRDLADKQAKSLKRPYGVVEFSYSDVVDDDDVFIDRETYVSQVMGHLADKGFAERIKRGSSGSPSVWNVAPFLGYGRAKYEKSNVEIEVVSGKSLPAPTSTDTKNQELLSQIHEGIEDMVAFFKTAPSEMVMQLRSISQQLELTNPDKILQLEKEKEELESQRQEVYSEKDTLAGEITKYQRVNQELHDEVNRLRAALEEAQNTTPSYSSSAILRYRATIMGEVDRMINQPWKLSRAKDDFRRTITTNLNNILNEIGLEKQE